MWGWEENAGGRREGYVGMGDPEHKEMTRLEERVEMQCVREVEPGGKLRL